MLRRPGKRLGVCLNGKKRKKLNFVVFAELCRKRGIEVIQMDLTRSIEDQGPFDVIIHKLSELMVEAEQADLHSQQLLRRFQDYVDSHPQTILLDPLPAMQRLADRFQSYKLIQELQSMDQGNHFCNPPYLELETENQSEILRRIKEQNLSFPFICKTRVAQGSSSHNMALIFNEDGLQDIRLPCVLQSFINHNAVLYKIFVVGQSHFVVKRPSLKNFALGKSALSIPDIGAPLLGHDDINRKTIFFNSHEVSKPESRSHLTERDEQERHPRGPSDGIIQSISRCLQTSLGLSLFGVDVIVDSRSGKLAVIDINAFPGYEGVPEFFNALLDHVEMLLREQERNLDGAIADISQPVLPNWLQSPQQKDSAPSNLRKEPWTAEEAVVGKWPVDSPCF
ncbi:inositol-tetrakisphosphate 1-kinase-like isoform X3 [Hypanus sabinus]|uniref:inositol-tetrakisphosphate 1-kinase-like isoform X3 n=1 Tax=Hypanus sabinus TaxID=79690 RepID=UPI0028C4100C|nr:inositol-tetrakisphosphate 1-kinase-like isoform X3 [Hypanus sabinus]